MPTFTVPIPVFMTLDTEVQEQMFRSGGQSDAKHPVFSSQASLVLIYRPIEKRNAELTLPSPEFEPWTCGVESG
ncbi:hypothetical protein TNCV_1786781 [Trichonephila clavipes]|nr:hypothetical protein TNCV_1786781 [Trichonephila clavipes]